MADIILLLLTLHIVTPASPRWTILCPALACGLHCSSIGFKINPGWFTDLSKYFMTMKYYSMTFWVPSSNSPLMSLLISSTMLFLMLMKVASKESTFAFRETLALRSKIGLFFPSILCKPNCYFFKFRRKVQTIRQRLRTFSKQPAGIVVWLIVATRQLPASLFLCSNFWWEIWYKHF